MCGIAGVYSLTDRPPDPEWGALLVRALRHRGPDGEGVYCDHRALLVHTRLAIIDLTERGRQPMGSHDGRRILTLNGEIYNHEDIRKELEAEGVHFRSRSDTEVLLELLSRRGRDAFEPLLGMFAFALYDRETGDLLLARDRLGKRPLLYVRTPEYLAFASEAAALLRLPFVRARLDRAALVDYERYRYVPTPRTLVEGMWKLPPASTLEINARSGAGGSDGRIRSYWTPPSADGLRDSPPPDGAFYRRLDELFLDATRIRTVSDVPIGIFLSGGVDSNATLAALHRIGHRPIRAFTVGFPGQADERALARLGARRYADDHVEIEISPDAANLVPTMLRTIGEPIGDSAIVTTYLIAQEASRHVKVALNGDGGDELFGGYARYKMARRIDIAAGLPFGRTLGRMYYSQRPHLQPVFEALASRDAALAARRLASHLTLEAESGVLAPKVLGAGAARAAVRAALPEAARAPARRPTAFSAALFDWDTNVYLPDDLMVKVDLASMAHALENRSPFLDHRLFELVGSLPVSQRTSPWRAKPLLRRLVRDHVPAPVLRAKKSGFQLPLHTWLRGPLEAWLDDLVGDPQATGSLYRMGALRRELGRFRAGDAGALSGAWFWSAAVLELWAREFSITIPG
jgi:asparagine synthase (glutamine-hydrolysing)